MKTKKHAFVPSPLSPLEDRVALSGGVHFSPSGAAILTGHAIGQATAGIQSAFVRYATNGHNQARLNADLTKAVSVVPYNRHDGLVSVLRDDAAITSSGIKASQVGAMKSAFQQAVADLKGFVQQEATSGRIVIR
jgi:hypothetical protein